MTDDHMQTADVWAVLDLIVAEWTSDPRSVECFDSRLRARAAVLVDAHKQRREAEPDLPFVEMSEAVQAYLKAKGWLVLSMTAPAVEQDVAALAPRRGNAFRFVLQFVGRMLGPAPSPIIAPGNGGTH